jgi:hypothetical protein
MLNVVQLLEVKQLLQLSKLPFEDIDAHFTNYIVAMINNEIGLTRTYKSI